MHDNSEPFTDESDIGDAVSVELFNVGIPRLIYRYADRPTISGPATVGTSEVRIPDVPATTDVVDFADDYVRRRHPDATRENEPSTGALAKWLLR